MLSMLQACSARLIAVGGSCADNSDAVYSGDFPKAYSRTALIDHDVWVTKKSLHKEHEMQLSEVHHHFS